MSGSLVRSVPLTVAVPRPVLPECCSIVSVGLQEDGSVLHDATAKKEERLEEYVPCCLI